MLSQLKDRIECVRGVTYKASSDLHPSLDENSITLLRANNIQDGRISFDDVQYVDKSKVKKKQTLRKGDILICASSGSKNLVGKAALVQSDIEATFGAFCCVVRPTEINQYYLGHYFRSATYRRAIEAASTGTNINNLKPDNFRTLLVPEIPEGEQAAIAMKLDCILEQVSLEKSCLHKLDELVKSRFIEMFGDPIDESSPWPKLAIKDFCTLKIGPFGSSLHKQDYITGGRPLVNPSHIVDGKIVPANDLTISEEKYQEMEAYHLEPGDVVLGRRGEIGRCAVVYSSGYLCGTGSMIVRPSDKCRPDYLQRVLSFPSFKDALERNAVGQTMKNLNAKIVGQAVVALPSINAQNEFAAFVQQVEKLEFETQQAIDKLQTLYDSLAQEYFGD